MQAPAAMFIEAAADQLKKYDITPNWIKQAQRKELTAFGSARAQELKATGLTEDFVIGYELGLETARVILIMNPQLQQSGIDPKDIL